MPNVARHFTSHGTDPALNFHINDTGHVFCDNGCGVNNPEIWCKHSELAMVQGWDSQIFWPDGPTMAPDQFVVMVPVFPTAHYWTQVIATRNDKFPPRYIIEWDECILTSETEFLCLINPGEGRQVIRTVLIEHMLGHSDRPLECQAGHHSFAAEMTWQKTMRDNRRKYYEMWSVFTTKQCRSCANAVNVNDDDLIPDKQNSVWS